jgi:hypothetical protein
LARMASRSSTPGRSRLPDTATEERRSLRHGTRDRRFWLASNWACGEPDAVGAARPVRGAGRGNGPAGTLAPRPGSTPPACRERCPCRNRVPRVYDCAPRTSQPFSECPPQKKLVPVPVPECVWVAAQWFQEHAEDERRHCQRPRPGERVDEPGGSALFVEIATELTNVSVNASDALLRHYHSDNQRNSHLCLSVQSPGELVGARHRCGREVIHAADTSAPVTFSPAPSSLVGARADGTFGRTATRYSLPVTRLSRAAREP